MTKLLAVDNLATHFFTDEGVVRAVDGVSFHVSAGETFGIVGESGSGKSVMSLSVMRLIQSPPGKIVSGRVDFEGNDLRMMPDDAIRKVRGKKISMIFQEPMTALDPVFTIGDQIGEMIALHEGGGKAAVRSRTLEMLKVVGIPAPERRIDEYPHQLSGGMRQRAMIAMALSCRPKLLIADEPTTALDVTVQAQILELMRGLKREFGMAIILVTHDLGVVAEMADRVGVMYAGKFVEMGTVDEIFSKPMHPYTQGLMRSIPKLSDKAKGKLWTIPGQVPNLAKLPAGCAFAERCGKACEKCRKEAVPDDPCGCGRLVRCFFAEEKR